MSVAANETSFFVEKDDFFRKLKVLLESPVGTESAVIAQTVKSLTDIVDRYQEQPHLLDTTLPNIVGPVMSYVRTTLRKWHGARQAEMDSDSRGAHKTPVPFLQVFHDSVLHGMFQLIYSLCKIRGYKVIVKLFPHEVADLEPALQCLLCQDTARHELWETRYVLLLWLSILVLVPFDLRTVDSIAVGPEQGSGGHGIIHRIISACKSYLPDAGAVRDAAAICLSRLMTRPDMDTSYLTAYCDWAACALTICSAPAHVVVDPTSVITSTAAATSAGLSLGPSNAIKTTVTISASGAATSLGVISNNVVVSTSVAAFISELESELGIPATSLSAASRVFLSTGVMQSLVEIAKHGHREALRSVLGDIFSRVVAIAADAASDSVAGGANDQARGGSGGGVTNKTSALRASPLLRKLIVKLAARTALTYMPPRLVSWRYNRGQRSLLDNLSSAGVAAAKSRAAEMDKSGSTSASGGGSGASGGSREGGAGLEGGEREEEVEIPPEMEDIIDMLLSGLRDTDTVVRWSAAKGVGRVTGRLPRLFGDDVVAAVLQLLAPAEGDGAWHGGCLALAELARRGLLLPFRLPEVVPVVLQALSYDVRKGAHSVGQHVRDAACYVCWAFARAYAPSVMRPHILPLARGMLVTALFDREVNCRRAASAAFQENVGRQGHENFPNGIAILTAADYFTLGNRTNAYLSVAPQVAKFSQYRYALLEHLLQTKLRHWDKDVRLLTSQALGSLAKTDTCWAVEVALPYLIPLTTNADLSIRHGAILGVAELILSLAQVCVRLPHEALDQVRNIIVKAEKARAYTGRGGEMVRAAMCRLIECQCLAGHPLSRKASLRLLQSIDDCLKHPNDAIQAVAVVALKALATYSLNDGDASLLERLPKTYATKLTSDDNPAVRRGMCLALGALPRGLLCATVATPGGATSGDSTGASAVTHSVLDTVVDALVLASKQEKQAVKRDAETRRNAVMALTDVMCTASVGTRTAHRITAATSIQDNPTGTTSGSPSVNASASGSERLRVTPLPVARCEQGWAWGDHQGLPGLTMDQFTRAFEALECASHDYAIDNRGDVGSWVRKAALEGLEQVVANLKLAQLQQSRVNAIVTHATGGSRGEDAAGVSVSVETVPLPNTVPAQLAALSDLRSPLIALHAHGLLTTTAARVGIRAAAADGSGGGATQGHIATYTAGISGYGAGSKLSALAAHELPDAAVTNNGLLLGSLVSTAYGAGCIRQILAAGTLCEVEFQPHTLGSVYFPYGAGYCAASNLTASTASPVAVEVLSIAQPIETFLTPGRAVTVIQAFLRALAEKLDLLRGVAGDGLCRLVNPPFPIPATLTLPHYDVLARVFPPNFQSTAAALGAHAVVAAITSTGGAHSVRSASHLGQSAAGAGVDASGQALDATFEEDEGAEDEEREAVAVLEPESTNVASGTVSKREHDSSALQWSVPHQSFPRLVHLLSCQEYVAAIVEGLVTSVGGLSESVVKHSTAALLKWAQDAKKAGDEEALHRLGVACLATIRPRKLQPWDVLVDGAGGVGVAGTGAMNFGGYTSGYDPSMARWFKDILGGESAAPSDGTGSSAANTINKLDNRLVTPGLRTTEILLSQACLDALQPPGYTLGMDILASCRRRAQHAREDAVRIMAAGAVTLGLLHFAEPVRSGATCLLLDLLAHPFPRIRKVTAETLYVKLLTLGDAFLCVAPPATAVVTSGDAVSATTTRGTGSGSGAGIESGSLDAALAVLTETPWDAELSDVLSARDSLYSLLHVATPPARSGVDLTVFGPLARSGGGKGGAGEDDSYGALVREMGY